MAERLYDVVGIGSAIVDIIARCDDDFIGRQGLSKGSMRLIDAAEADRLYAEMGPAIEASGGTVPNTCAGLASFGGKAAFIGRVARDQMGAVFTHDIRAIGVTFTTPPAENSAPTARSLILVTPDGERTMNTFLGAASELTSKELDPALIGSGKLLYLEGYSYDQAQAKQAFYEAAEIARAAGTTVALSLSDPFCVDRHRADFLRLIRRGVDLVFANESEVLSLYETADFDAACQALSADTKLAAVTRSAKGSVILSGGEAVAVAATPVEHVVDTTGAGDLYASGFLFGHARGLDLAACGRLGSLAAAEVISHIGPRPEASLAALARAQNLI
jgi:sugar/nucleoside kinase (ribokinase family)